MSLVFSWKDKDTWPQGWPGHDLGPSSNEAYQLASRLERIYEFVVVYHACRPLDVATYYRDGLRTACHSELLELALRIFADGRFPEISREDVLSAADLMPTSSNARLDLALDDRHIINRCGHYLLYGSEYVTGIAGGLTRKYRRDYRQYLKNFGRPTLFKLHLPLDWISGECLGELASVMSRAVLNCDVACEEDFTVSLRRPVPPEFIKSHVCPVEIRDPLTGETWLAD